MTEPPPAEPSGLPRGVDHVGVTVPDIDAATTFLATALGAEVIYDALAKGQPPQAGPETARRLGLADGGRIVAIRMLRLGNGPGIELFEMEASERRPAARPTDFGLQHLAVYVDDMDAAVARFRAAGGDVLGEPHPLPPLERGPGNAFCYGRTPWGMIIELITYPSAQPYLTGNVRPRWTPAR